MEAVAAASKSSLIPLQEYLLQGSIVDKHVDILLHRLNGLCDTVDTGPERFHDHEMVFQIKGSGNQGLALRVRRSLEHSDMPWHLRYVGQPEMGDKSKHTLVRQSIDVGTSDNVVQFLQDLGFRMDYEYLAKGYLFRKGRMKVIVSKIFRMGSSGVVSGGQENEALSQSHQVELSVLTSHGHEHIQDSMKNFAEQLKPLVQLEKVDHRRLQQT